MVSKRDGLAGGGWKRRGLSRHSARVFVLRATHCSLLNAHTARCALLTCPMFIIQEVSAALSMAARMLVALPGVPYFSTYTSMSSAGGGHRWCGCQGSSSATVAVEAAAAMAAMAAAEAAAAINSGDGP